MRKLFATTICVALGVFSAFTTALSQSARVAPTGSQPNASHFSTPTSELMTRLKKPGTRRGVPVNAPKPDASWFRQMRDPCQVEG
jgi:hypothetical protein